MAKKRTPQGKGPTKAVSTPLKAPAGSCPLDVTGPEIAAAMLALSKLPLAMENPAYVAAASIFQKLAIAAKTLDAENNKGNATP